MRGLIIGLLFFLQGIFAAPEYPNIIIFLADDMGQGDLGTYNSASKIPTPNMDKLAAQGMKFVDSHSNSSVCTPTRYGIITGRYAWRSSLKSGVLQAKSPRLIDLNRMTIASMLKQNGYHTGAVGKWHLGLDWRDRDDWSQGFTGGPNELGFNYFFGISASLDHQPYAYLENDVATNDPTGTQTVTASPWPAFWRGGGVAIDFKHMDVMDSINAHTLKFIREHVDSASNQPFFLYVPYTGPHTPHIVPPRFEGSSQAGPRGDLTHQVDWAVGNTMDLLDSLNIAENTVVFLTADNGADQRNGSTGEQSYTNEYGHDAHMDYKGQKADIYEAGHRVPFLVRWPGKIKAGSISNEIVCTVDFMATAAALAGFQLPSNSGEDSYSLLPELMEMDYTKPLREAVVHHSLNGTFSLRKGDWKLTDGNMGSGGFTDPRSVNGNGTLYDLVNDISEINNLYGSQSSKVNELKSLLDNYKNGSRSTPTIRSDFKIGCMDKTYNEYDVTYTVHDPSYCLSMDVSQSKNLNWNHLFKFKDGRLKIIYLGDYQIQLYNSKGESILSYTGSGYSNLSLSAVLYKGLIFIKINTLNSSKILRYLQI